MQIAILLFDNVTALDAVGPYEVLSLAEAIQCGIEYDPHPRYDAGSPEKVDPALVAELLTYKDVIF